MGHEFRLRGETDFTIHNAGKRVEEQGDIFKSVLGNGIDMKKALKNLQALIGES